MPHTLIVWGLNPCDPALSQQFKVFVNHGCEGTNAEYQTSFHLEPLGSASWVAVDFAQLAAAKACAADLQRRYSHLEACMEPDWRAFGRRQGTALADLVRLAERLGCQEAPHALPRHEAACLSRGVTPVLDAFKRAGGWCALSTADPAAAKTLGYALMEVTYGMGARCVSREVSCRLLMDFSPLGPEALQGAAAEVLQGIPGAPQRACAAARLAQAFLRAEQYIAGQEPRNALPAQCREAVVSDCIGMLETVADALPGCCMAINQGTRRHGMVRSAAQRAGVRRTVMDAGDGSHALQMATQSLLCALQLQILYSSVDERRLLAALGRLTQQLVVCEVVEGHAAAAGLRSGEAARAVSGTLRELHITLVLYRVPMGIEASAAAGVPALHTGMVGALRALLNQNARPQHIGLLLGLSMLAQDTQPENADAEIIAPLVVELSRVLQLAASWLAADEEPLLQEARDAGAQHQPFGIGLEHFSDQLSLTVDINAHFLSDKVMTMLERCKDGGTLDLDLATLNALAAPLKVEAARKCEHVRRQCSALGYPYSVGCCTAPGLVAAGGTLLRVGDSHHCKLGPQHGAAAQRPWATAAMAPLLHGGLGSFWLAHAEAAAQAALPAIPQEGKQLAGHLLVQLRQQGTYLLHLVRQSMSPHVARTFGREGAVPALLQALMLPPQAPPTKSEADTDAWQATQQGVCAICELLAAVLGVDAAAGAAVLRDGSWDAAEQRVRSLRPSPLCAAGWAEQRDAALRKVAAVLGGRSGGSRSKMCGGPAAADAEAVAAADRAMQELLAEEQAANAPNQRSKAASKRARKKAARQQPAAAATPDGDAANGATDPAPGPTSTVDAQAQAASRRSKPTAGVLQPIAAAAVPQPAVDVMPDGSDAEHAPTCRPAATGMPPAQVEWSQCALSGQVMRDPVLYGGEGHSFERAALDDWLAFNPGIHPLSGQPLAPGACQLVPNHALRNLIQQLNPG